VYSSTQKAKAMSLSSLVSTISFTSKQTITSKFDGIFPVQVTTGKPQPDFTEILENTFLIVKG
jgi:hypothetical protein